MLDFVSTHSRPKAAGLCNISGKQRAKKFQHTAARRRLGDLVGAHYHIQKFQHTAARRRLVLDAVGHGFACVVSTHSRPKAAGTTKQSETTPTCRFNTQPPEGGWRAAVMMRLGDAVSTHSRPKAAGQNSLVGSSLFQGFNTQPPEGGWKITPKVNRSKMRFNTQPPEGGWLLGHIRQGDNARFQHTAARRRLATGFSAVSTGRCFNTQPPEGGWVYGVDVSPSSNVSTHSRPKAAGCLWTSRRTKLSRFQHTAARRRLGLPFGARSKRLLFQHTAARRRLDHAGNSFNTTYCFNTQPPEGGWY